MLSRERGRHSRLVHYGLRVLQHTHASIDGLGHHRVRALLMKATIELARYCGAICALRQTRKTAIFELLAVRDLLHLLLLLLQ